MAEAELLPIKVVIARKDDYRPPEPAPATFGPVVDVTPEIRRTLGTQIDRVLHYFQNAFEQWPAVPAVAKVSLRTEAYAKTKRPVRLFSSRTCQIISVNCLGELLVSVTPTGLRDLKTKILRSEDEKDESHISTIGKIIPYTQEDAIGQATLDRLSGGRLRLRLFSHRSDAKDRSIEAATREILKKGESIKILDYPGGLRVFEIASASKNTVATLAGFPGTQGLDRFPKYHIVRGASRAIQAISGKFLPVPRRNGHYPLVGMIDTGTDPTNSFLQAWVHERWDLVPSSQQDNTHGSFVAGLLCQARMLNHGDGRFPSCSAKIVDVVGFDSNGEIDEPELMHVIRESVRKFPDVKVWNLSFSIEGRVCQDHSFSPLAMLLDELSRDHGILFVIASGNTGALKSWPRLKDANDGDRICSPADSVTSLVVGGMAHRHTPATCVREDQPSPFTRRGPGAAYLIAPQVMHVAGNCTGSGDYMQTGVLSVDGSGHLAEDIGTSFAAPSVASLTANVMAEISAELMPNLLARAMVMHSAFIRNAPLDMDGFDHTGVGRPPDLDEVLYCRQSAATVVLQADLGIEPIMLKHSFPMPQCLIQSGSLSAEILMTLVYTPPFDTKAGFEYCQTNVDASLGAINSGGFFSSQVPTIPKAATETWERDLIKYGYKWSPVKFYYRNLSRKNALGSQKWELRLSLKRRSGVPQISESHVAYLLVTIKDRKQGLITRKVYDELVTAMTRLGWGAQDLKLQSRERFRGMP
jgi:serine protease AprX